MLWVPCACSIYSNFATDLEIPAKNHLQDVVSEASAVGGLQFAEIGGAIVKQADLGNLAYWRDDIHLNALGHQLLADVALRFFLQGDLKVETKKVSLDATY